MGELSLGKWGGLAGVGEGLVGAGKMAFTAFESQKDRDQQTDIRKMLLDAQAREGALDRGARKTNADRLHEAGLKEAAALATHRKDTLGARATEAGDLKTHREAEVDLGHAQIRGRRDVAQLELDAQELEDMRLGTNVIRSETEDMSGNPVHVIEIKGSTEGPWEQQSMDSGQTIWLPKGYDPAAFTRREFEKGNHTRTFKYGTDEGDAEARAWGHNKLKQLETEFLQNVESMNPKERKAYEAQYKEATGTLPWEYEQKRAYRRVLDKQKSRRQSAAPAAAPPAAATPAAVAAVAPSTPAEIAETPGDLLRGQTLGGMVSAGPPSMGPPTSVGTVADAPLPRPPITGPLQKARERMGASGSFRPGASGSY